MTSLSDKPSYRTMCRLAAGSDYFATFRRHPSYTEILEHVTPAQGQAYLDLILRIGAPRGWVDACYENDRFGGPTTFKYSVGELSPTTLRYMYQVCKLRRLFGPLTGMRIVEIGGGYGGLARLIQHFYPCRYSMIDLVEPLQLQARYLAGYNLSTEPFALGRHDLTISNYAFTECERPLQVDYLQHVLLKSDRGYITGNFEGMDTGFPRMTGSELVAAIPRSARVAHDPPMGEGLWVLLWGLGV